MSKTDLKIYKAIRESKEAREKDIREKEEKARKNAKKLLPKRSISKRIGGIFSKKNTSTSKARVGEAVYTKGDKMVEESRKEIMRTDPDAIKNPNDLLRKATVKVYTDMNRYLENEMATEINVPTLTSPSYNEDGSRYTKMHSPISDATLTTTEKIRIITNISKPDELSKMLLRPPTATQCISRLQFWTASLKTMPREQLIAHLLYVAVAHYNLSFLNQMILSALPGQITIQHGEFIDHTLLCFTRTNKLLRAVTDNIKEKVIGWSHDFTHIFEQLLKTTNILQKQDDTIMSYEEAIMLLIHYTYNPYFNLWPTHCANGSPQFRDLAYIQDSSHTVQTEEMIIRMLAAETAEMSPLQEKSEYYYRVMIDAIQQSPNAPISITDKAQRQAITSQPTDHPVSYHQTAVINTVMIPSLTTLKSATYSQQLIQLENMELQARREVKIIRAEIDIQENEARTQLPSIINQRVKAELEQNLQDAITRQNNIIMKRDNLLRQNAMSPPSWQSSPHQRYNEGFNHQQTIPYSPSTSYQQQMDDTVTAYDPNHQMYNTASPYNVQYPVPMSPSNQYQSAINHQTLTDSRYSLTADQRQHQQQQQSTSGPHANLENRLEDLRVQQRKADEETAQTSEVASSQEEAKKKRNKKQNEEMEDNYDTEGATAAEPESRKTNKQESASKKPNTRSTRNKQEEQANERLAVKLGLSKDNATTEKTSTHSSKMMSPVKFRPVNTDVIPAELDITQMTTTPNISKRHLGRYQSYPNYKIGDDFRSWYAVLYTIIVRIHNNSRPSETDMCEYLMEKLPTEIQTVIFNNPRIESDKLTEIQAFIVDKYANMAHPKEQMNKLAGITMKRGSFQESMDDAEMKVGALVHPSFETSDTEDMIEFKKRQARIETDKMICQHILPALNRDEPDIYDNLVQSGIIDIKSMDQDYDRLKENLISRDARHLERHSEVNPKKFHAKEMVSGAKDYTDNKPSAPLLEEQDKRMMLQCMKSMAIHARAVETNQQTQQQKNNTQQSSDTQTNKAILQLLTTMSMQNKPVQTTTQSKQQDHTGTNQQQANYNRNRDLPAKRSWKCRRCETNDHTVRDCPNFKVVKRNPPNAAHHALLFEERAYCMLCKTKGHWPNNCNTWKYVQNDKIEPGDIMWSDQSQ